MALNDREQAYLDRTPGLKRLTFNGCNDLYLHPRWGSYDLQQCMEKDALASDMASALIGPRRPIHHFEHSMSLEVRNERCIDQYGCGTF